MDDFELMVSGRMYSVSANGSILSRRNYAKNLCYQYNQLDPSNTKAQESIIRALFGKTANKFCIMPSFWCDYGCNIEIGDNFFINHNGVILDGAPVKFGDNVLIGANCTFNTASHPIDAERRLQGIKFAHPITVGNNVWIGSGVHVMPGIKIGNNVVIGGGSIVVNDIPDDCVAVGNPCRKIREITEADRNKNWDWLAF